METVRRKDYMRPSWSPTCRRIAINASSGCPVPLPHQHQRPGHVLSVDILDQLLKSINVPDDERMGILGQDPGFRQKRELSRNLLAIRTDPACDVRMPGRWINPGTVVHDTGLACKAEDFGVNAILHS